MIYGNFENLDDLATYVNDNTIVATDIKAITEFGGRWHIFHY